MKSRSGIRDATIPSLIIYPLMCATILHVGVFHFLAWIQKINLRFEADFITSASHMKGLTGLQIRSMLFSHSSCCMSASGAPKQTLLWTKCLCRISISLQHFRSLILIYSRAYLNYVHTCPSLHSNFSTELYTKYELTFLMVRTFFVPF
jgi:hypothetical protein